MDAAELLIAESARRWKWAEGDYRDDITAIVVFLPFLEGEAEDGADQASPAQTAKARPPRLDASDPPDALARHTHHSCRHHSR